MRQLPVFVNLDGRTVILLGEGAAAGAKRRLYGRAGAVLTDDEHADGAALAVVAIEDEAQASEAAQRLKARGLLVNVVDRPNLCDFTTPAIVDRDRVLVAISTGGASAGLAKALRQRIEAALPARLGALAQAMADARDAIRARWPLADDRRRAIDAAFGEGGPLDPLGESDAEAVSRWLSAPDRMPRSGLVELRIVSDDPDDLTVRAARLLGQADRVYHDPGVADIILERARADAERIEGAPPKGAAHEGLSLYLKRQGPEIE